ncbi:hypothetical protein NKR23_g4372 [Pleurostoma richardsiae]|uniref:CFEM domain-containing protein n=1 Tax=Pleurostoma richardsiae TaxID=41990 RepID=A0AA38VVG8_9PEZI|nr:hypothetical protein NKR23_g4372 [Pleurostoma richardsiae]
MHMVRVVFPTLLGLAVAADIGSIIAEFPSCTLQCMATAAQQEGCGVTDYPCQCQKGTPILADAQPCLAEGCTQADLDQLAKASKDLCDFVASSNTTTTSASLTSSSTTILLFSSSYKANSTGLGYNATTTRSSTSTSSSPKTTTAATTPTRITSGATSTISAAATASQNSGAGTGQLRLGIAVLGFAWAAALEM